MSYFLHGVSEDSVIQQFSNWLYSTAFRPKHSITINADGNIHRYSLERDKAGATSGAYALHLDGRPAGFCQDWHDSATKLTWKYDFSDEERREYGRQLHNPESRAKYEAERKEHERRKAEEQKLQEEKQQAALRMAINEYLYADLFGQFKHPYLRTRFTDKGIHIEHSTVFNSFDVRSNDEPENYHPIQRFPIAISRGCVKGGLCKPGEVIIPMLNVVTGEIQSLIHIPTHRNSEGKFLKLNYTGLSIQGAAHELRPKYSEYADTLFCCEGIVTAIAVMILTGEKYPVFSAGACGNLRSVCAGLRKRYTNKKIVLMADNDEPGLNAAKDCLSAGVADDYKYPPNIKEDFYDYLARKAGN